MPTNFPEMWVNRVETNLTTADAAPFLAGITELDTEVVEMGSGSASEQNIIHIPNTDFEVDILINNEAYPLALQQYTDNDVTISLDKYQTKQVPISDDQAMGASYRRIDAATMLMVRGILEKKYGKAIWGLAPAGNTDDTPVLTTTGQTGKFKGDGTPIILKDDAGRLRLTYIDLVAHKDQWDKLMVPVGSRRLTLSSDHWNDLLLDRERFGDSLNNLSAGTVAPIIAGFKIYTYINNPLYDAGAKLAYGTVAGDGQYQASVSFAETNVALKTGLTKQFTAHLALIPAIRRIHWPTGTTLYVFLSAPNTSVRLLRE